MERYKNHSARIAPAPQPLPADIQQAIDAIMRGNPPLVLFTTLARDQRLFFKFFNSGLGKGRCQTFRAQWRQNFSKRSMLDR
ncbi:MAG: hypothetical protein ACLQLO_32840 [Mycobacterium sp.]